MILRTFSILPSRMRTFNSISTCSTLSSVSVNRAFFKECLILSAVGYCGELDIGQSTVSAPSWRFGKLYSRCFRFRFQQKGRSLTISRINLQQASVRFWMNSVSNSLSVYQGPPVREMEGSIPSSMYIFRVMCFLEKLGTQCYCKSEL